ncbi:Aste57867_15 [Aphanomyces stellatus]|uniref:Aste57867_15 protein n=1 Tax=Aphanomyces stellatus TaxID=120398 RepID=A0A485K1I4_9STRA|nr:hypothetical protein As57867_000015 [Aphanomyces stellatus]VFT77241.1 Aste57867_15 [Aphanomyces stellatus]
MRPVAMASVRRKKVLVVLNEEVEAMILAYVAPLPNFIRWLSVSKRWGRLLASLPATSANFDLLRGADGNRYLSCLQRWPMLTSVSMTKDVHVNHELQWQQGLVQLTALEHLSLRHTHGKVLQEVFKACPQLKSLTVLECNELRLPTVKCALQLRKLELHVAKLATNGAVVSILRHAPSLTHLMITAANELTSQVLVELAVTCPNIQQVILSQCGLMVPSQVDRFLESCHAQLTWLDLSHCRELQTFPEGTLDMDVLEVLVLDNTLIRDSVLDSIRCPKLQLLSVQNCRNITDDGVSAFAVLNSGAALHVLEAKNTAISDTSVIAIEQHFSNLTHLGVESCRGVSRETRQRWALQCHRNDTRFERVLVATNAKAYKDDNRGVVMFSKNAPKNKQFELDEDYNPRHRHDDDDDDAPLIAPRRRASPAKRKKAPVKNTTGKRARTTTTTKRAAQSIDSDDD